MLSAVFYWLYVIISWLFVLVLLALLVVLIWLWRKQGSLLYLSEHNVQDKKRAVTFNPKGYRSPQDYDIPFEDVYIKTPDNVRVHAWLMLQPNQKLVPTIVVFHGNAGNIGFRLPMFYNLYHIVGCNILAVDYRGYGNSDGIPSQHGLVTDATTAIQWVHAREDLLNRVYLYGQSLGGGVCFETASQEKISNLVSGIIVENTFTSIDDMVVHLAEMHYKLWWVKYLRCFLAFYLSSHWPSIDHVTTIKSPILFLSGLRDELIPPEHMRSLFEAANNSKLRKIETFPGGTHNDTHVRGGEMYFQAIKMFVKECQAL